MAEITLNYRPQAYSWSHAKRLARELGPNKKVELAKNQAPVLPPEFKRSLLSIPGTAKAVYRDVRKTNSFQVREYENKWTIELDRHNPDTGNAIAHALVDAPVYTLGAALLVAGALSGGS